MSFAKTYIQSLFITLSNPRGYVTFLNQTWKQSLFFFILSYCLIGLSAGIAFRIWELPALVRDVHTQLDLVVQHYPQDLRISWDGSQLTTSQQPIVVPYPENWLEARQRFSLPKQLLVIDPQVTTRAEAAADHPAQDTLFLMNANSLQLYDNTDEEQPQPTRTQSLTEFEMFQDSFTIQADNIGQYVTTWKANLSDLGQVLSWVMPIVLPIFLIVSRLWILTIDSILLFILLRISNSNWNFGKLYQLGLHVIVPAEMVHQLAVYLYPGQSISLLRPVFWLLFLVLMVNLRDVKLVTLKRVPKKK